MLGRELAAILFELSNGNMPDIFWDGILPRSNTFGQPADEKLIIRIMVMPLLTLNPIKFMLPFFDPVERDISEYDGQINPLPPMVLN